MKFITSLHHKRIERQQYCLNTWMKFSTNIVAVQAEHEIEVLRNIFPFVKFVVGEVSDKFSKPTPKITELIKQADEPSLLINSDISVKDKELSSWNYEEKVIKLGIRLDYRPVPPQTKHKQKYGIDAFLIGPDMIPLLPDLDFCIGCPGWDFWLPYHLWAYHDYQIRTPSCNFLHELHPIGWTEADQRSYRERLQGYGYKLTPSMLAAFILDITNRNHLKPYKFQ
jgi:hypothetical protein